VAAVGAAVGVAVGVSVSVVSGGVVSDGTEIAWPNAGADAGAAVVAGTVDVERVAGQPWYAIAAHQHHHEDHRAAPEQCAPPGSLVPPRRRALSAVVVPDPVARRGHRATAA